jgi:zinc transporter 1
VRAAEEGQRHSGEAHDHTHDEATIDDEGNVGEVFPEAVVAMAKSRNAQRIKFSGSNEGASPSKDGTNSSLNRSMSKGSRKHRRRTSSVRNGRFTSIDDISIHPASFRQDIIAASRPQQLDGIESGDNTGSEEEAVAGDEGTATENSPLLSRTNGKPNRNTPEGHKHGHDDHHSYPPKQRHDSCHISHNHNKPKKPSKGGHGHNHADMGMNAMILHVIGDALGNVGVIVSALIIWLTTWSGRFYADPAVSLFITIIILKSTVPLTSATAKILLQATPDHIDVNDIKEDIQDIPGVISCHHVHIWQLSDTQIVASMHIQVAFPISEASGEKYMELAKAARKCLHAYGIHSATIQPEFCLDKDHDHTERPALGLDGIVGQPRCRMDDDCLLECVDDCEGRGCCTKPAIEPQHDLNDHDGHVH